MKPEVIVYTRISTGRGSSKEEANETRLSTQKTDCEEWCKKRNLMSIEYFHDEGVSGVKSPELRPGFSEAIKRVGKGTIFLVSKGDRLARDQKSYYYAQKLIEDAGGTIKSTKGEGTEGADPDADLVASLFARFQAEKERRDIITRTKRALDYRRQHGMKTTREPPIGWRALSPNIKKDEHGRITQNVPIVPDEREQAMLKLVFELKNNKDMHYSAIAKKVAEQGFMNRRGNSYSPQSIRNFCHSTNIKLQE